MVSTVKYRIKIMLKNGILDNAGKATTQALRNLGFSDVSNVRIGKTYEFECEEKDIERIAKSLTNEVMENYRIDKG